MQIDLCMRMPFTVGTSALRILLRSAVVFKASLIPVCVMVFVCHIANLELIEELS